MTSSAFCLISSFAILRLSVAFPNSFFAAPSSLLFFDLDEEASSFFGLGAEGFLTVEEAVVEEEEEDLDFLLTGAEGESARKGGRGKENASERVPPVREGLEQL